MTTEKDVPQVKAMMQRILDAYAEIPQAKLIAASRRVMTYSRAIIQVCEEIESGARDSSMSIALRSIDNFLATMQRDLRVTQQNGSVPMLQTPSLRPEQTTEIAVLTEQIAKLSLTDEQKIGFLLGVVMTYCKKAGLPLRPIIDQIEADFRKVTP